MSGSWGYGGRVPPQFLPSSRERIDLDPHQEAALASTARAFDFHSIASAFGVPLRLISHPDPADTILPDRRWRRRRRLVRLGGLR